MAERYFVINRWHSKGGHLQAKAVEYLSHREATVAALLTVLIMLELSGDYYEDWEVFVGSKAKLDRMLKHD